MNKVILTLRLTKEPEQRYLPDGQAVTTMSAALNDGYGDKKKTLWMRVSTFGKTAENCNQFLKKGSRILVDGRLQGADDGNPRTWQSNDNTTKASFEIIADRVEFLDSRTDNNQPDEDSEIPF
jgi:single-strand DNA-binding protein